MACQEVHVIPGGKLSDLCQVAISRIEKDMCNTIIYFIAGIPDICTMKRKTYRYHKYEESFLEFEIDHVSNMKACILDTERQIKELGGKVVFKPAGGKCHSTTSKWWKLKIKTFLLNKIYHPIQKKYTSQNVKGRRAKQISVM
jgi:hypothetical protein